MSDQSSRSARAQRRAAKVRNQRIAIIAVVCLVIATTIYLVLRKPSAPVSELPGDLTPATGMIKTASGLQYQDLTIGNGPQAKSGDTVVVNYTGWLEDGTKFDSSLDRGEPFGFTLGAGRVIRGWDEGVAGMQVGGKRKLVIPPELGYGNAGAGNVIPPNATLIFEVELLEIQ